MENLNELYKLWCENASEDKELIEELKSIEGKDDEILDRFYKKLEFGTAGLRGILGAGTNRMNIYTVNQATQGLCDYLNANFKDPSVAIAYDSRINSELFAKQSAGVFAANGIKVYFFPELVPTPMLSFAVRRLQCSSGIIITASHNPSNYNGYKCYDPEGYQMTDEAAKTTYEYIEKVDIFKGVKKISFNDALAEDRVDFIEDWLVDEFYDKVQSRNINPDICKASDLKVIYTPLNGTGSKPVRKILKKIGIKNVSVVKEQEKPNGKFPTCPYPNPEIKQAFEYAIKMAEAQEADILLATDPDCDRVGIAVFDGSNYKLMSGNEVGALLTEYTLSQYQAKGIMPENPLIVKSFVTTELIRAIAKNYDAEVVDLLTGFKYIGELITNLEKDGKEGRFILGIEESYGYLSGTHARDKDAVVASMLICEMAAFYKSQGKTLLQVMDDIYNEYGIYINKVDNIAFEGAQGLEKMADIMNSLRQNPPRKIAGFEIENYSDYKESFTKDIKTGKIEKINLPSTNALFYRLPMSNGVIIRPSGTEPKIKIYYTACCKTRQDAENLITNLSDDMKKIMKIN